MIINNFRLQVLVRVLLICATALALVVALVYFKWYVTSFCLGLFMLAQIAELTNTVEKTNRELSRFLSSIRHHDFTQRFVSEGGNKSFRELNTAFNEVIRSFQEIKADKEAHYLYLQTIIEHIGTGIVSFDEQGEVRLINKGAKNLLHLPHLKNISSIARISPALEETFRELINGEKKMLSVELKGQTLLLMLQCTEMISQGEVLKIISLHNIRSEMEEQELEAWQKLIRVLTHEIMNSVTPVISLASTINTMVDSYITGDHSPVTIDEDALLDIRTGLRTIEKRSTGMLHFVESYRKLTRVRKPQLENLCVKELLSRIYKLLQPELENNKVRFEIELQNSELRISADPELMEQVLINLVKNAMEACSACEDPFVALTAYTDEHEHGRLRIDVRDNGPGIPPEILDKIFVPFYTTKKQGSGIGLSLSRQIMRLHKGSLRVQSAPGNTVFSLVF